MKNYNKTISDLFDLQKFSIKMGLENITKLCDSHGNPQNSYPTIHVAGTNGKGSTSIMIQQILSAHGLTSGLYTSPHLVDFRERIRVNDKFVEHDYICEFWDKISLKVYDLKATFFDTTTAMAFDYFEKKKVDVAIIETGLGGRLDSTNILKPVIAVVTPIDVDHIKQLGVELPGIAHEKAAIIKDDVILFTGEQCTSVELVLDNYRSRLKNNYKLRNSIDIKNISIYDTYSTFDFYDKVRSLNYDKVKLNLPAAYQIGNAMLAYLTAHWYLEFKNIRLEEAKLRNVFSSIQWPGRLQRITENPNIYFDVSHNFSGFQQSLNFIKQKFNKDSRHLLIGLLDDKEYKPIVEMLQKEFNNVTITEPIHERSLSGNILQKEFLKYGVNAKFIKEIDKSFERSRINLLTDHSLFVMGSHFLIGELQNLIKKELDMRII